MKKPTLFKIGVIFVFLFFGLNSIAQNYKPFTARKNIDIKGSMLVIGNNILGQDNLPFNDATKDNQDISMQYIDIDADASTFSSSSAELLLPPHEDGSATTCYRVAYAALYWGAVLQSGSRSDINKVKFKLPGASTYIDITGEVVYDAIVDPIPAERNEPGNTPYACYADVTNLFTGVSDIEGFYTTANVTSSLGFNNSTGLSAGWTLFIIYEDPSLHTKSITTFDGFAHVNKDHFTQVDVTGFTTPPVGNIDLQFAYAALDGDRTKRATKLEINGKEVTTPLRGPANKFFGSVIENTNGVSNPRNPDGSNTLGYDTGFLEILNSEPEYIKNNVSNANFSLQVAPGQADPIFAFFSAFAVDIIAPDINLTKIVEDDAGNEIDGDDVYLGQNLFYEISYQSTGNDNVTQFTIKDALPQNIVFNPDTDLDLTNAGGATLQSYDPVTRTLIFNIPDTSVEVNDPVFVIRIAVQIVPNCYDLSTACSNEIMNQAFATYRGVINTNVIQDEGSFATTECLGTPGSTNFLVDISNCEFKRNEVLCGASVILNAADGYDSYSWSRNASGTPVIGTGQTFTATETGTYYVQNTTSATCVSIQEEITVIAYGNTITNPVIPYADLTPICPNDGKVLPYIFLCGANATRLIETGISDATSIIWEQLNEASCDAQIIEECANENPACSWNQVGTGANYTANTSGQFRLVINYPGGCFSIFYFNVYQNLLNPTATARDILCTTNGQITVGGVPSGYEYSLNPAGPYQASNIFDIATPGYYTVYIRQVGVDTNPCIFSVPDVYIRQRDFTVTTIVNQPSCNGDKGSVILAANDALPQYYFSISQGGTLINSVGPILESDYTFANLNPGTYTVTVTTDDGCTFTEDITIINPPVLTATVALTKALTCTDGEITVYPVGGTPPYEYFVNGASISQSNPEIAVPSAGTYNITVVDFNNCSTNASIDVVGITPPTYTVNQTDILCTGDNTGTINFNVTNANGYAIEYSIDNGVTYTSNPTFYNLTQGLYQVGIKYALNGEDCFSTFEDLVITEPNTGLTASAGVSELAGCGPAGEGKVRITNPQGGTPPFEYSFDNQTTWVTTNEAYLPSGTYTLYIRDANGCIYSMPGIIIDPQPIAPTISVSDPDYNCDGTGNTTVTVTNSSSNTYSFGYLLDGVENPNLADPKTFLNVSEGNHTISVTYKLETVPTYSNLLFEDFGSGPDVTSPGINPNFCFERQVEATKCNGNRLFGNGEYTVTNELRNNPYIGWWNPVDHTTGSIPGRFLAVDAGFAIPNNAVVYRKRIYDIIPNQPIQVRFFATNLLKVGNTQPDASLTVELQDSNGVALSSESTGGIPKTNGWVEFNKTINPGNNTTLDFVLRLEIAQVNGIDFAVDDIEVYQLPSTCITQEDFPFIIQSGQAFSAEILSSSNVNCSGDVDGSITVSAQNFDPVNGFDYSLDNGATWINQLTSPFTISNLNEGTYTIQVRYDDAPNTCSVSLSQTITAPTPLSVSATATPITCLTGSTVTVTASGGTPAYNYELLDAATLSLVSAIPNNGILTDVAAGNYIARVTDTNGCTATTPINIVANTPLTANIINADYCFDASNGASLEVLAAGGQAPYEYNINGSAYQASPIFNNLIPGTYDIIVRDAYGCDVILPTEVIASQVAVSVELTKALDCSASPEAVISGTISEGYAPYTVTLLQGTGSVVLTGNTFTLNTATDGSYQFEVTDAQGCKVASNVININALTTPTVTTNTTQVTCNGDSDGTLQLLASGGSGGYTFSSDNVNFSTNNMFSGLTAGTYTFYVQDSNNCTNSVTVTITEPTAITATASATAFSCSTTNTSLNATITIDVPTTGTPPYTYSFNGGSSFTSQNTLTVTDNGTVQTFSYVVRDANGCLTAPQDITLQPLNAPTDLSFVVTDVTCLTPEATATLTATNGVGILQYETIAPSPIVIAPQTSNIFNNLVPGTYIFRVTDANGCYYTESYTINPVTNINVTSLKLSDVLCNGDSTGAVQFNVSGFASTYAYTINGGTPVTGQTNATITLSGLAAGSQVITLTDEVTGCVATETVIITEPALPLSVTATATNVYCNNDASQITITAAGGTPVYTYAAVSSGLTPNAADYTSSNILNVDTNLATDMVWDVYVKDANGCETFTTVTIIEEALPTVTAPSVSNQCSVSSGFTFTVSGTGVAPLAYSINGGVTFQSSPTFVVNAPGNYTITIRDGNGCTATSVTTTDIYPPLTANVLLTKDITCSAPAEASITISVSGGNAPYTYEVSNDGGSTYSNISGSPFTTSVAGTYQFRITDANGCNIVTNAVTVTDAVNPVILNVTQTQFISCSNEESAAIDVSIDTSSGLAPFVINVTNTTTGTNYGTQTSGLAAGNYVITVTDAKGCEATQTTSILEPTPIVLDFDVDPITCGTGGVSLGQIIINSVSGGTPNYTYHVTGVNGYNQELTNQTGTTQVFEVVDFGLYEIIITDANGCSYREQNILVASPPDDLDINISATANCLTGGTAEVSIGTTLSGSGPYRFAIYTGPGMQYNPPTTAPWQDEDTSKHTTFTNLIPGATYTFIVFDELTDCYYYETSNVPVPTNSTLSTTAVVANNITCKGSADGSVSFDINSIYLTDTNVNYEIYNSQSLTTTGISGSGNVPANGTLSVSNLGPLDFGNYVVVIEETSGANAGCSVVTATFNITESAIDLSLTAASTKNENCNELGVITAIAQNGTSPYQYQAVVTGNPVVDTNWNSSNTFNLPAGDYDIYVRDAYGCIKSVTETIILDPLPTINPVAAQCFDGTPLNITLVEGSGLAIAPLTYSIGGAYQSNPNFILTAAGSYTVSIKDGNGCMVSDTYVVNPPLLLDAVLSKELDCTVTPDAIIDLTPSGGTGVGPYSYEVNFNNTGYVSIASASYTATTNGTYQFRVTNSQSCTAESAVITVEAPVTPTITTAQTNVSCNLGADGSIIVTPTAGVPPFEYSINGGAFQASNAFYGLSAGTYNIVVRDSKSCESLPISVTITEPTPVSGSGILTQGLTCGVGNATQPATVTITGIGGTAPYTYSFDGGINYTSTNIFNTYNSGTVSVFVKDANGCISTTSVDVLVPALDAPTDLDFSATDITCVNTTSDISLTPTNGTAPFTYEIVSPVASATSNTTGVFNGLAPDTYVFTVTDVNGCYYTESYTITPVTNISVFGLLANNVSCTGGNDGAVDFNVSNFSGTYSYTINGGSPITGQTNAVINLTGLTAGNQTIVVTDDLTGCTATASINVSEPVLLSLTETNNINANCNADAQVTVEASNGTAPYQYAFVQDGVTPTVSDYTNSATAVLNPSTNTNWDVWVLDSKGCTAQIDVVISNDALPRVDVPVLAANQCNLNGDAFTFTVTNPSGIAPFEYSIGNGFQTSPTFTVTNPGTYNVTIKDANGCTFTNTTPITIYAPLNISAAINALPSCTNNDGEITVTGFGGSGNYTFAISPSAAITQTGNVFSGLAALTPYTVTITDVVTNCTNTVNVNLDAPTPVSFTTTTTAVSCAGSSDGSIIVNLDASNNNPLYTYAIIAGPTTYPSQASNIFTGLAAGNYTVEVTSGRSCTAIEIVTVAAPNSIVVSAPTVQEYACTANTNTSTYASISVTGVTGGLGNYTKYEFIRDADGVIVQSGSNNVYTIPNLLGGSFTINVYDDNGCLGTTTATVNPFISLDDLLVTIDQGITCTNDEDITVSVTTTGGNPANLLFTLEDANGILSTQTNNTGVFTALPIGNYIITVENVDTGCSLQTVHYVNNPNTFDIIIDNVVDVTCFSDIDGRVDVTFVDLVDTPTNDAGPFTYTVVNNLGVTVSSGTTTNAGSVSITGLASGTYTLNATLTNTPFCSVTKNFTITAPTAALAITTSFTEITCISGNNDGAISATATGGWPGGYEYQLETTGGLVVTPFGTASNFTGLSAGDYIVSVRDSKGCLASMNIQLVNPTPITLTASADITMLNCFGDTNATITVTNVNGGQGSNYTYTLNTILPVASASGPQTSPVFSGLGAGTYNVTVTDGYNCSETSVDIVITEPSQIIASLVKATSQTCLTGSALTLSATGGTGAYEYSDSPSFTNVLGNFTSSVTINLPVGSTGTFRYYVRDTNGCTSNVSNDITIDPLLPLTIDIDDSNAKINCAGDTTGVIVATAQGGLGNYTYTLQDAAGNDILTATQNSPGVFTNLPVGTYQVFVTSGDCEETSNTVTIAEPSNPLLVNYTTTDVTCNGGNDGVLEISATGGTGIVKYAISPQMNQFFEEPIFENLAPGTYQAIAQDELGCYVLIDFTIDQPSPVIVSIVPNSILPEYCDGDMNGEFSIEISGGVLPYSVALDDINGAYTTGTATQTQFDFNNLSGGDHIVYVRDAQGCESEWNITFPEAVKIVSEVFVEYGCTSNLSTNSVIVVVDPNFVDVTELDYSLDGGAYQSSNEFLNVPPGLNHFIDIRHSNGCIQQTQTFDVSQYEPLQLSLENGGLNEILAVTTGGTGDYTYTLNGESYGSTNTFIIYESGNYIVTVTDSNGCFASATKYFEYIDVCIPNYFTPNGDGVQDGWGPGCTSQYKDLTFNIFDRYGRKVATLKVGEKWDGKYNGVELPTGDYWYVVKLNDEKDDREFVGHFTLYR
ncbi:T9SS type B sorting domain-containing protein [Siansivirga zeaxanthinifaciens]|uniref:PKD/Chitinase domain-containing protein n=1 Tax=Siansivirga zeaxanthinifaciens CC-SAMT-1 TaxID=1454006 RepID=A0A0C5W0T3_9FLAO|nr:T9SS type B sorting domain-containing protein [Siansivirga zeaxanthinifaciens]AJR04951.1 hypothetical protein AW14_12415 [Siansivirga zeaxanthinifaciens CC-SAMT-1]